MCVFVHRAEQVVMAHMTSGSLRLKSCEVCLDERGAPLAEASTGRVVPFVLELRTDASKCAEFTVAVIWTAVCAAVDRIVVDIRPVRIRITVAQTDIRR